MFVYIFQTICCCTNVAAVDGDDAQCRLAAGTVFLTKETANERKRQNCNTSK